MADPRGIALDLPASSVDISGNPQRLSPLAQRRITTAIAGLLGAIDGLAQTDDRLAAVITRCLAADALLVRRELERAGYTIKGRAR